MYNTQARTVGVNVLDIDMCKLVIQPGNVGPDFLLCRSFCFCLTAAFNCSSRICPCSVPWHPVMIFRLFFHQFYIQCVHKWGRRLATATFCKTKKWPALGSPKTAYVTGFTQNVSIIDVLSDSDNGSSTLCTLRALRHTSFSAIQRQK